MQEESNARFPVVIKIHNDIIARLNPDRTWCVHWETVRDQAYATPTDNNALSRALCRMMLAGRDNFLTSSWDKPQEAWEYTSHEIDLSLESTMDPVLVLYGPYGTLAYITRDGDWAVNWEQVLKVRSITESPLRTFIPIFGMLDLLYAGKDNFPTIPMKQ